MFSVSELVLALGRSPTSRIERQASSLALLELVAGDETQDRVLAVVCQPERSAYSQTDLIFQLGLDVDAQVLLRLVGIECQSKHGVPQATVKLDAKGKLLDIPVFEEGPPCSAPSSRPS